MKKYVPIIKWKAGEKSGLLHLDENTKNSIIPLIELVDYCEPEKFAEDIKNCFNKPVYIDTIISEDDYRNDLKNLITSTNSIELNCIPVLYPVDLEDYFDDFNDISSKVAVKIELPLDLELNSIEDIIDNVITKLNANNVIDVILDIGNIENSRDAAKQYNELVDALKTLKNYCKYLDSIIIASTSFPKNISGVPSDSETAFKRYDFIVYKKIMENSFFDELRNTIAYSDYGVTKYQDTEIDFSKMSSPIIAKIRYTTYDDYIMLKGKNKNITNPTGIKFPDLAARLVKKSYYFGSTFSFGDLEIYKRSNGMLGPGNGTNWVAIAVNHHITVVVKQLSSLDETLNKLEYNFV
ncbi:hypothetical protein JCM1393_00550 [Clostridium carnis]